MQLILFSFFLIIISISIIAFLTFKGSENRLEHYLGLELQRIANTSALMINGDHVENVFHDEESDIGGKHYFLDIQKKLIDVRDANQLEHHPGLSPLYILRKHPDFEVNQLLEFVVMTDTNEQGELFVGATIKVEDFHFRILRGESHFTPMYKDIHGYWVSAAAPIYNSKKQIVGLLQVDRPVNFFQQKTDFILREHLAGGALSLLGGTLLSFLFAWFLIKPIKLLIKSNQLLSKGKYDHRINNKRFDEFGVLFDNFNQMASSLQTRKVIIDNEERVISKLLELSFLPIEEFLQQAAKEIVSLEWLSILPESGIFLTDDQGNSETLRLFCHFNLAHELITLCAKVSFGTCHCGRAAQQQQIQFSHCVDSLHDNRFPSMKNHGNYNVPILQDDKVLGVLVLYLKKDHQQQKSEFAFLQRVAHILSLGISQKYAEQKAHHLAYHDALTNLPNRLLLMNRLKQLNSFARRNNQYSALIYIDFDHFKYINDSLGHSIGDLLLIELGQRITQSIRMEDTVARLGGDEFAILITRLTSNLNTTTIELNRIIIKLQNIISKKFTINGHSFFITMSAGIVILTGKEDDLETVLMQADTAMYQSKADGRNSAQYFLPEMQEKATTRVMLEKDLRLALAQQELSVYYQPQINDKGELVGAEALLRWKHPKRGFVSPAEFIPVAEETGLIIDLGEFVLIDACNKINQWHDLDTLSHIAVNVSPLQFNKLNYVYTVKKVLKETGANPEKLTLELTESILVNNIDTVIEKMQVLKEIGINFSIDDFGTGYSSLAYLKRFPLDQLKIDKTFVDDINLDPNGQVIIETIIAMADRLGFNLIAEGVETAEQLSYLKENGCFNYQGYYFSQPIEAKNFEDKYLTMR